MERIAISEQNWVDWDTSTQNLTQQSELVGHPHRSKRPQKTTAAEGCHVSDKALLLLECDEWHLQLPQLLKLFRCGAVVTAANTALIFSRFSNGSQSSQVGKAATRQGSSVQLVLWRTAVSAQAQRAIELS